MEAFSGLLHGFSVALQPINVFYCFLGVVIGTLVGVLPGLGPASAIALLLPSTFHVSPVAATIMLAGIYYGAMYGGSTTSILVNIPGEAASVVTCLDGYRMARQGRAGPALGMAALASFIGGTFSIVALTFLAPVLANFALKFGPPEYCALILLGLTILAYLAEGSMVKALMMAGVGIILSTVGLDTISGSYRFTYGFLALSDGLGLIPVVMGLFGLAEVFLNLEGTLRQEIFDKKIKGLMPNSQDWKDASGAISRGTILGFFLGILPGGGAIIASFTSYALEKRLSKHPEKFGAGVIEGVAGPEAANNSAAGGAFIPLLTLGIPANPVMAILLGGLMINGLQPGPLLIKNAPDVFWGVIASMYMGNVMLLLLNLPLIGMWIKVLKVPYYILFPLIILFCLVSSYSLNNTIGDAIVTVVFGVLGYLLKKFGYEAAPLILALVLGPMLEESIRQALIISQGSFAVFLASPISAALIGLALVLLVLPVIIHKRPVPQLKE
jgi:putative tricarboxylic transport membrane protein